MHYCAFCAIVTAVLTELLCLYMLAVQQLTLWLSSVQAVRSVTAVNMQAGQLFRLNHCFKQRRHGLESHSANLDLQLNDTRHAHSPGTTAQQQLVSESCLLPTYGRCRLQTTNTNLACITLQTNLAHSAVTWLLNKQTDMQTCVWHTPSDSRSHAC